MPILDGPLPGTPHPGTLSLDEALELTRTGDIWIFRGNSTPDRAIRLVTNAPVNHVGMAVVLSDLPPLMWHAELGQSLIDVWSGEHHRGAQLHDLRDSVLRWAHVYRQQPYLRQLHPTVDRDHEDALLRAIARYNGTSFPSTAQLAWRWTKGRGGPLAWVPERARVTDGLLRGWQALTRRPLDPRPEATHSGETANGLRVGPEAAYCAEVVALTYESMGILAPGRPANWYDPGRFWSGDELPLMPGWVFGAEIMVDTGPAPQPPRRAGRRTPRWATRRGGIGSPGAR
ncbi:MAG: hypothetical protein IPI32_08265 [Austwickia sp.]|nr:hypothetical protein [Austwickia sp.]